MQILFKMYYIGTILNEFMITDGRWWILSFFGGHPGCIKFLIAQSVDATTPANTFGMVSFYRLEILVYNIYNPPEHSCRPKKWVRFLAMA